MIYALLAVHKQFIANLSWYQSNFELWQVVAVTHTNTNQSQMNPNNQEDNENQNQNSGHNASNSTVINHSPTQHITSNTYVFTTPIKLTQNSFILWRSQVISNIRANELEDFVNGSHVCPPRHFTNPGANGTTINTHNLEYQI